MKTTHQILGLSDRDLRRLVVRLQVEVADHEQAWSGAGHPDDRPWYVEQGVLARRIKREVYAATKGQT